MRFTAVLLCLIAASAQAEDVTAVSGLDAVLERAKPILEGVENAPAAPAPASDAAPLALDVAACIRMALEQNPQAAVSDEAVAQAEARVGQAKAARRPQIAAQAGATYQDGLEGIDTPDLLKNVLGISDIQPDKTIARGTVSVEQVLFAGGQITNAIKASKFLAQSESWKREVTRAQLAYDATQAYHDAVLAHALIEVAADSIKTFQQHEQDAQHALEVGMVSKIALLRAQTELAARQADLTSANTAYELALLNLKRIIGAPEDQAVTLADAMSWNPGEEPLQSLIEKAKTTRPELMALEAGIEAAEAGVRVKKGEYLPRAAATAQWQEATGAGQLQPNGFSITGGIEWQIYGGGKRKAGVAEAEAQLRSLQHQHADVLRLVEMDVRQASLRVHDAIEKIRRDKGTVTLAQEGFRLAEVRFKEGVGTQTEMLDAELALTQAKTKLMQALRDYAVAVAALDKAVGRIAPPAEAEVAAAK